MLAGVSPFLAINFSRLAQTIGPRRFGDEGVVTGVPHGKHRAKSVDKQRTFKDILRQNLFLDAPPIGHWRSVPLSPDGFCLRRDTWVVIMGRLQMPNSNSPPNSIDRLFR